MKKKILYILFFVFFFTTTSGRSQFRLGLRGMMNIARLDYTPDLPSIAFDEFSLQSNSGTRTGFGIGGLLIMPLTKNVNIQAEVLYIEKGGKQESMLSLDLPDDTFGVPVALEADLNQDNIFSYLTVPVLLRINLQDRKKSFIPFLTTGVEFGFLQNADAEINADNKIIVNAPGFPAQTISVPFDTTLNVKDEFTSRDFAINVGAGIEYKLGKNPVLIEIRYSMGYADISDLSGDLTGLLPDDFPVELPDEILLNLFEPPEVKTRGFQVIIGITF